MKPRIILLKLFPYVAGFICSIAIIIFVLLRMSAIGWYAILTALIVTVLLIWHKTQAESKIDGKISLREIRFLEERLQSVEDQIDELMHSAEDDEDDADNDKPKT